MAPKMDFQHYGQIADKTHKNTPTEMASIAFWNTVRENFTITTWMLMGAVLQGVLVLFARPTFAVAPAVLVLLYRFLHTMLMHYGFIPNVQMRDVIVGKFTVQIPDKDGKPPSEPSGTGVAVLMLALRNNHALGIFGPGGRETFISFKGMLKDLEENKESGFLGISWYRAASERLTGNGFMTLLYFRSVEDIQTFAHGKTHRDAWTWFNGMLKKHPHLSIMHEVYSVQKKNWENIFVNHNLTGIGKILQPVIIDGKEYTPLVDAMRGPLSTHKGRTGISGSGTEEKEYLADIKE